MYLDFVVRIPGVKGKITFRNKNGVDYVYYEYDREYNRTTQKTNPKRATIGKRMKDDPVKMRPNTNFLKYFPDTKLPEDYDRSERSSCLKLGGFLVVRKIFEEYRLPELLGELMDPATCGIFLDYVAFFIIMRRTSGTDYGDYVRCHPLFTLDMRLPGQTAFALVEEAFQKGICDIFFRHWNERRNHAERIYLALGFSDDGTQRNMGEAAGGGRAEDGWPGDGRLFDHAVAFCPENAEPLFYERYPKGSAVISQTNYLREKASGYGYDDVGFVFGSGYLSGDAVRELDRGGVSYAMGQDIHHPGIRELLLSYAVPCREEDFLEEYGVYGQSIHRICPLYGSDETVRWIHLYYSSKEAETGRTALGKKLLRMRQFMEGVGTADALVGSGFETYFTLHVDASTGKLISADENLGMIQDELSLCGYSCIVTTEKMSAKEALDLYRCRGAAAELFHDRHKMADGFRKEESDSDLFAGFIALLLRNKIIERLQEDVKRTEGKKRPVLLPEVWKELEKLEMVRLTDNHYHLANALTDWQESIFNAFGIDRGYIRFWTGEIRRIIG